MMFDDFKGLIQLPLVFLAVKLTWKNLTQQEKEERLSDMWVAIIMTENPLLSEGMTKIYDWCLKH